MERSIAMEGQKKVSKLDSADGKSRRWKIRIKKTHHVITTEL